jgi:hypothetical protein
VHYSAKTNTMGVEMPRSIVSQVLIIDIVLTNKRFLLNSYTIVKIKKKATSSNSHVSNNNI